MSFTAAHQSLTYALRAFYRRPPRWLGYVLAGTAILAAAADLAASRTAVRLARARIPDADEEILRLLRQRLESLKREQEAKREVSRYLMEEGNPDLDTDCFSCASAHIAGMRAALENAAEAYAREGKCGPECQRWLEMAVEEPAALFARDWTDERKQRWPEEHRRIVDEFSARIAEIQARLLRPERQELVRASALLSEAVRFAQAGDSLDHPEVRWRLAEAEAALVAAERSDPGSFDPDTAQALRRLRQTVSNKIFTTEDVIRAAREARQLARSANSEDFSRISHDELKELAEKAREVHLSFRERRMGYAR